MPGRNLIKQYAAESYYHFYNRGVNKNRIFRDQEDFIVFLALLKRYLGINKVKKANRTNHPNFYNEVDLLAYCLMSNHFHLFIYQKEDPTAITNFMRSLATAYGMYFNRKYKRVGPVFQQRYRAVRITDDAQLLHISRYIHLNPDNYNTYEWSSLPYYLGNKTADWVKPNKILELFDDVNYADFVADYKAYYDDLNAIKQFIANTP